MKNTGEKLIPIVVNSKLLREIDERKLINRYARFYYLNDGSVSDDASITSNLLNLLSDTGELPIYFKQYESIKRRDIRTLVEFIKSRHHEIKTLAGRFFRRRQRHLNKLVKKHGRKNAQDLIEKYNDPNYTVRTDGYGCPPKWCVYKGRVYKSRIECQYKEGLTYTELYKYLAMTDQIDKNSILYKKYHKFAAQADQEDMERTRKQYLELIANEGISYYEKHLERK